MQVLAVLVGGKRSVFTPDTFLRVLWRLKADFVGFKQQDAQECNMIFRDMIKCFYTF